MKLSLNELSQEFNKRLWSVYGVTVPTRDYALVFPKGILDMNPFESTSVLYGKSKNIENNLNPARLILECYVVDMDGGITHCHMMLSDKLNDALRNSAVVLEDVFAKIIGCRYIGNDRSKGFEFGKVKMTIPFDTECVDGKFFTNRQEFKDAVSNIYDIYDGPDDIIGVDVKNSLNKVQDFVDKVSKEDLYFLYCDINRIIEKYEDRCKNQTRKA